MVSRAVAFNGLLAGILIEGREFLGRGGNVWKNENELKVRLRGVHLKILFVVFDNFRERIFSDVSVREGNFVENSSAVIFFRIPTRYSPRERTETWEISLDRETYKCLGDEAT